MKRKAILAIVVITISFSLGYLAYFGTSLLVGFLRSEVSNCEKLHSCEHDDAETVNY